MELNSISQENTFSLNIDNFKNEDIHVVLVYKTSSSNNEHHVLKRKYFEEKLEEIGLILTQDEDEKLSFVKIHAPQDVLCHYCEIMRLRMPMKKIPGLNAQYKSDTKNVFKKAAWTIENYIDNKMEVSCLDETDKWTAEFSANKDYLFDLESKNFFSPSDKCIIINYILERNKFGENSHEFGIKKLLNENVYKAYYPLHDGDVITSGSQRSFFSNEWAALNKIFKYQPIDDIKNYFGVKFALYFTWLGFYTTMLIPASIIGILCMIYGIVTLPTNNLIQDICQNGHNIIMCPTCDFYCDYWRISDECTYSKITHIFDNYGTIFFGFFMSIWSALYIELWKRYSAEITHRWGLSNFDLDAEHPRPEYLTKFSKYKKKLNILTNQEEPVVPFCKIKLPTMVLSFSFALFWVFLAIAAVFGVVIYRMAGIASNIMFDKNSVLQSFAVPITAGLINLVCITTLNFLYDILAYRLTKYECHRTQIEFDDSLTLKIYMFQFVNYYSSLFYIAFLKGKFIGFPMGYNRVFGFRQEECNLGGCMMELFMQLAIIMIGKQALNSIVEIALPKVRSILKKNKQSSTISNKQWVKDYYLESWDTKGLFSEYLEIVIQYGFITIFVVAFPLAPFFALLNNIFEMRLDAKKYVTFYKRPVSQKVKDIGIWFNIIEALGRIAIVSNAFIIAFSSNFLPLLVHIMENDSSVKGYLNASLSYFNVSDFETSSIPQNSIFGGNITECRYADYRKPYRPYARNDRYWYILTARMIFIVIYQNTVAFIVMLVRWAIPDVPKYLRKQIKREALRTNDYIIEQEALRTKLKKCKNV